MTDLEEPSRFKGRGPFRVPFSFSKLHELVLIKVKIYNHAGSWNNP
jgi:hypothetical protein